MIYSDIRKIEVVSNIQIQAFSHKSVDCIYFESKSVKFYSVMPLHEM